VFIKKKQHQPKKYQEKDKKNRKRWAKKMKKIVNDKNYV